jgi:hypothetical protein
LLRQLRCDAPENPFRNFWNLQLAADFHAGINFSGIIERDLQKRIFHLLGSFNHGFNRKSTNLARIFVELRAKIFLRLVILARGDNNGIFDRGNNNLRVNTFFSAERVDRVVKLTCHKKPFSNFVIYKLGN